MKTIKSHIHTVSLTMFQYVLHSSNLTLFQSFELFKSYSLPILHSPYLLFYTLPILHSSNLPI